MTLEMGLYIYPHLQTSLCNLSGPFTRKFVGRMESKRHHRDVDKEQAACDDQPPSILPRLLSRNVP